MDFGEVPATGWEADKWGLNTGVILGDIRISYATAALVSLLAFTLVVITLHGQAVATLRAGLQYWFITGAYINILQVYAFCNAHDVAWGTKGLATEEAHALDQADETDEFAKRRAGIMAVVRRRAADRMEYKSNEQAIKESEARD